MAYVLGIDTGGTYTDGALLELPGGSLAAKIKTPTLHGDLKQCIANCIGGFKPSMLKDIERVCLSTTLATNALVENITCPTGLLLIGGRPDGALPTEHVWQIEGRSDIMGREKQPLDADALKSAAAGMRNNVQAVAISGYASVRNPSYETAAAEYIRETLKIPTVCAHELTGDLGFYERTVTAVLDASLVPLICELIDAVEEQLRKFEINAPLMIVRGNGLLMSAGQAKLRPIETILSGPAASISGGVYLSGLKDAVILDMGGTTSDMALVCGGETPVRSNGARVGGWNTRVEAFRVFTCGLGGDSRIRVGGSGRMIPETRRVMPYCRAAEKHPRFADEIKDILNDPDKSYLHFMQNELEGYILKGEFIPQSEPEKKLRDALIEGPHTMYTLRSMTELGNAGTLLNKMTDEGHLFRIAMTPTDVLHADGELELWDRTAPKNVVKMLAEAAGVDVKTKIGDIKAAVYKRLADRAIEAAFFFDGIEIEDGERKFSNYMINDIFGNHSGSLIDARVSFKRSVVAVGAPASSWAGALNDRFGADVIFPEHGEVAAAVGAAAGRLLEKERLLIRYDKIMKSYILFAPDGRKSFARLEDADAAARESGSRAVLSRLPGGNGDVSFEVRELTSDETGEFIERTVEVTAVWTRS